jgi:hypothetical protein
LDLINSARGVKIEITIDTNFLSKEREAVKNIGFSLDSMNW